MRQMLAILIALACVACASTPPNLEHGKVVPPERVVDRSVADPSPDKAQVVIARWNDAFGAAVVDARVYIDGRHVANVDKGEVFRAYVSPGRHTVGVKLLGLDSTEQPVRTLDFDAVAGKTFTYEVFWAGNAFDIQPKS